MPQQNNPNSAGEIQTLRGLTNYGGVTTQIIIPKIQRDYAQGREGKETLRRNFLDDLFEVIESNPSISRLYDYIYGQLEVPNPDHPKSNHFYPVDGQQRLTTFYLLHLYIGKRAGKDIDFLKNFSYQTRNSSRLFCEMLCDIDPKEYVDIISYIEDSDRYTSHWRNDPTISSMMRMLGDIHERFVKKGEECTQQYLEMCWANLLDNVQFWMLDLSDLKTTDDIYIKMNSRGKALTAFENFKAELDNLVVMRGNGSFTEGEYAMKIDTTWTNLFWKYRDKSYDLTPTDLDNPETLDYTDNGLDDKMLNFFRNYLVIEGLKNGKLSWSKKADKLSTIELAELVAAATPTVFGDIKTILDFFSNISDIPGWFGRFLTAETEEVRFERAPGSNDVKINSNPLSKDPATVDYLAKMMEPRLTTAEKLFVEALFYLILHRPSAFEDINHQTADFDRLRILRNLITNSELHDDEKGYRNATMRDNLTAVDTLMALGLQAVKTVRSEFSGVQIDQEIDKCEWLTQQASPAEQAAMKQLENHSVLRGNLKVLYGMSPLSLTKIDNFRRLFVNGVKYDTIEQIALSYDDYAIVNGNNPNIRNYAYHSLNGWRDRIFVNSNTFSVNMFEKMLATGINSYAAYVTHKDSFLHDAHTRKEYPWTYYLCNYPSMRWAPKGYYLLAGTKYLYYMFNAGTCIDSDTYIHWNVYNFALHHDKIGDALTDISDRGGALTLKYIGVTVDVLEDYIRVALNDTSTYRMAIPQIGGIDSVDRIELSGSLIGVLYTLANGGKALNYGNPEDTALAELKKLSREDITPDLGLVEDKAAETEVPSAESTNEPLPLKQYL